MAKHKLNTTGIVYSTDPGFSFEPEQTHEESLAQAKQPLKVLLDKKQRAGKAVTLVTGYAGPETDIESLGKKLKTFCGTGGSVKNREIIIQGDNREKVLQWLNKNGYTMAKKS